MNNPYKVLPDDDTGGWWISGPSEVTPLPKWVAPCREVIESVCSSLNDAYEKGAAVGDMEAELRIKNEKA